MRSIFTVAALCCAAGSTMASVLTPGSPSYAARTPTVAAPLPSPGFGPRGADVSIDVSGLFSWDGFGDTSNQVLMVNAAALLGGSTGDAVTIEGLGWDVDIETTLNGPFGGSWLSEARFTYGSTAVFNHVGVRPGFGSDFGGHQRFTNPVVDLSDNGIPDLVLPNGWLRIELNETFDDSNDQIDAAYLANSFLTIRGTVVPAPGAIALAGLGGLLVARRRR